MGWAYSSISRPAPWLASILADLESKYRLYYPGNIQDPFSPAQDNPLVNEHGPFFSRPDSFATESFPNTNGVSLTNDIPVIVRFGNRFNLEWDRDGRTWERGCFGGKPEGRG